jgi:Domain of unknown function (DUF222)
MFESAVTVDTDRDVENHLGTDLTARLVSLLAADRAGHLASDFASDLDVELDVELDGGRGGEFDAGREDGLGARVVVDFCRPRWSVAAYPVHASVLETQAPGDLLGRLLARLDPAGLDMHDLVSFLGACERQAAFVQATQLLAVRELAGRRLIPGPNGEPADTALPVGAINDYAADEVAAVIAMSRFAGQKRVWLATALTRLPATEALFRAGKLNLSKTTAIVEGLAVLSDSDAATAEARVLVRAPHQTLGQLRASINRAVHAADPSTAKERAAKATAERRVELTPRADGMAELWALLPAADAMALWTAITALADKARAAERATAHDLKNGTTDHTGDTGSQFSNTGSLFSATGVPPTGASPDANPAALAAFGFTPDGLVADGFEADGSLSSHTPGGTASATASGTAGGVFGDGGAPEFVFRTMNQLRADVLADLAYATLDRADLPQSHRRRPHIQVTVAATTLLGMDEAPGELAGFGPIPAPMARQIAAEGTWRRLLTDPVTGGLLDYGTTTYDPPKHLADHVITRDQTCRGLGCRVRAERCDLDHTIRFPDGPTAEHNLTCECRPCHIRKHKAGWHLQLLPNGDVIWTSPTGHTYHDPVPQVLEGCTPARTRSDEVPPF